MPAAAADGTAVDVTESLLGQQDAKPGSPLWWTVRLSGQLAQRRPLVDLYGDYYDGRHRLSFASSKFREVFAEMLAAVNDNWMPLVIRAAAERLVVQGFRLGEAGQLHGDDDAWRIWQENQLDAESGLLFTEAMKCGEAAMLVWPAASERPGVFGRIFSRRGGVRAEITVEHPSQMIVARAAGNRRRRAAALKEWAEDDGTVMATLFLPDTVTRWQRAPSGAWEPRPGVTHQEPHGLGVVPVIPFVNDPQMLPSRPPQSLRAAPHRAPDVAIGHGRSDLADVISTQDQINKLLCDMLVASEVGAFRQRWATGLEVPTDPETNEPVQPFEHAINRLWVSESETTKFADFAVTELKNFTDAIEQRVQSLAARTRTPPHYLLGSIVNASRDALKASETGLACRVKDKQKPFGEAAEESVRLGFLVEGDRAKAGAAMAEVDWSPAESRSESEFVDSLVKKLSIGVPVQQLWEDAGYSPQQIARFRAMLREQALEQGLLDPTGQGLPPDPSGAPPA